MGHVVDRWTVPNPNGTRPARVKGPRWGKGKRWLARWSGPDGRERSKAFASKNAATAHVSDVESQIRGGTYVGPSKVTFEEYAREWLRRQVHQRPGTAAVARARLESQPMRVLGPIPLQQITRADLQELVVVAKSELAPSTIRLMAIYVRAVLASAVEDQLIRVSPWRRVALPEQPRSLVVPLSVEQVERMAGRLIDGRKPGETRGLPHEQAWAWRMFLVGAQTGLRPGELRGLTVDRVMAAGLKVDRQLVGQVARPAVPTWGPLKTDASYRVLPLARVTRGLIDEQLEMYGEGPEGLVFHRPVRGGGRRPVGRHTLSWLWSEASEGEGLASGQGWHALRHHHASLLIAAGLSPRAVADRLGHADVAETLRTYAHLWPSDEGRIVSAIEDAYGASADAA